MTIKVKESSIEKAYLRRMSKSGLKYKIKKMSGEGNRAWPDRAIFIHPGLTLFIEFKRPGEKPTELQQDLQDELSSMGFQVATFDNALDAYNWTISQAARPVEKKTRK